MSEPSLARQVGVSSLWAVGTRVCVQLMSLASMILLARWLGPEKLGLFDKAVIVLVLLDLISALGVEAALVQMKAPERRHYDTAWTLNLLRGVAAALIVACLSLKADDWFHAPGVGAMLLWISLQPLILGFENIGMVDARRNLRFGVEFRWIFTRRATSFLVAIGLAWWWHSPWALVWAALASSIASVIITYVLSPYRPRLDLSGWPELKRFVGWMFSYTTLSALAQKIDDLLLLRFAMPVDVALYRRAADLTGLPSTELAAPISRALLPGLSRLQDAPEERRALFVRFLALTMMVALPASIGLALLAAPFVHLLLGRAWEGSILLIWILAATGIFRTYGSTAEVGFLSIGRVDLSAKLTLLAILWRVPLMGYGLLAHGIVGLAVGSVAASLISLGINVTVQRRIGTLRLRDIIASLWRLAAASGVMALAVWWLRESLAGQSLWLQLLAPSMLGMAVYASALGLLWRLSGMPDSAEATLFTPVGRLVKSIRG